MTARAASLRAHDAVAELRAAATKHTRDGMARYGLPSDKAFGVAVADIGALGKRLGPDHELALALWETGWYEARLLAAFVDDPAAVAAPGRVDGSQVPLAGQVRAA